VGLLEKAGPGCFYQHHNSPANTFSETIFRRLWGC
jgi:hypothetical protein